jgi:hypothetical protein
LTRGPTVGNQAKQHPTPTRNAAIVERSWMGQAYMHFMFLNVYNSSANDPVSPDGPQMMVVAYGSAGG